MIQLTNEQFRKICEKELFHCFCVRKILWSLVGAEVETDPFKRTIYRMICQIPPKKGIRILL